MCVYLCVCVYTAEPTDSPLSMRFQRRELLLHMTFCSPAVSILGHVHGEGAHKYTHTVSQEHRHRSHVLQHKHTVHTQKLYSSAHTHTHTWLIYCTLAQDSRTDSKEQFTVRTQQWLNTNKETHLSEAKIEFLKTCFCCSVILSNTFNVMLFSGNPSPDFSVFF